jgi:hypothetical protein
MITQTGLFGTENYHQPIRPAVVTTPRLESAYDPKNGPRELGTIETVAKYKTRSITQVDVYRRNGFRKLDNTNKVQNLLSQSGNDNAYNGYLSPATKRNIEQMLQVWLTAIELNVNLKGQKKEVNENTVLPTFVTLTLPCAQYHRDNDIKEVCLKPFLEWLEQSSEECYKRGVLRGQQKGFGVKGFFWRAEPQKNRNIHFHVLIDRYVPWERIRQKWNMCLDKLGYVYAFSNMRKNYFSGGFRLNDEQFSKDCKELKKIAKSIQETRQMPKKVHPVYKSYLKTTVEYGTALKPSMIKAAANEKQLKAYEKGLEDGFYNPNTTDIHGIQNLDSVAAYVIKYCTKKPTKVAIGHNQYVKWNPDCNKECIYTYENRLNEQTGEFEREIITWDYYKPTFEERRINGRLWGCANILRGMTTEKGQEVIEEADGTKYTYQVVEDEIPYQPIDESQELPEHTPTVIKKPFYAMKYFTSIVAESVVYAPADRTQLPMYSDKMVVNHKAEAYIATLTNEIGKDEIDRISKGVGEFFERMQGRIIPLNAEKLGFKPRKAGQKAHVKHADIMKKFAPELHKDYLNYHVHIFNCLYQNAA